MPPVDVRPWVLTDVSQALGPTGRLVLDRVLFDLQHHLPNNLARYQPNRILPHSTSCFWYHRIYPNAGKVQGFAFVVRDADPAILDVIWVVPVA